jgi:uncharacterized protein (TIGR02145 family)
MKKLIKVSLFLSFIALMITNCTKEESGTKDCNGVLEGSAYIDDCEVCVGGTTDKEPCSSSKDCNEVEGGTAYLDFCDECVGGTTGKKPCVLEIDSFLNPTLTYGKVKDNDGNIYKTIEIGTALEGGRISSRRVWMAENLRTTSYNDGTAIPNITSNASWGSQTAGAWCYNNNDVSNNTLFGKLYNWHAVNTGKLCPTGWHIPTETEWRELKDDLIASGVTTMNVSSELKSVYGWEYLVPTNSTGFTALPGGNRGSFGAFSLVGGSAYWWSSSTTFAGGGFNVWMGSTDNYLYTNESLKTAGYSCRCIQDY